jgi:hypothetical protein
MSGGDATSRGHLNADSGEQRRLPPHRDFEAARTWQRAPAADAAEQGEAVGPSPSGGSAEADGAEVGGNDAVERMLPGAVVLNGPAFARLFSMLAVDGTELTEDGVGWRLRGGFVVLFDLDTRRFLLRVGAP